MLDNKKGLYVNSWGNPKKEGYLTGGGIKLPPVRYCVHVAGKTYVKYGF